jgi:hypothetical protein
MKIILKALLVAILIAVVGGGVFLVASMGGDAAASPSPSPTAAPADAGMAPEPCRGQLTAAIAAMKGVTNDAIGEIYRLGAADELLSKIDVLDAALAAVSAAKTAAERTAAIADATAALTAMKTSRTTFESVMASLEQQVPGIGQDLIAARIACLNEPDPAAAASPAPSATPAPTATPAAPAGAITPPAAVTLTAGTAGPVALTVSATAGARLTVVLAAGWTFTAPDGYSCSPAAAGVETYVCVLPTALDQAALSFSATAPKDLAPGVYAITVGLAAGDGGIIVAAEQPIAVTVK